MDAGQTIFTYSRLILGAAAAFLAIMLWAKTRDMAWMLMVIGVIIAYIGTVHSILEQAGIVAGYGLMAVMLAILHLAFFVAAFLVMVIRKYKHTEGI